MVDLETVEEVEAEEEVVEVNEAEVIRIRLCLMETGQMVEETVLGMAVGVGIGSLTTQTNVL